MDGNKVIHGDCLDVIPTLGHFDFIFADPPFNIGQKYNAYEDKITESAYRDFTTCWVWGCRAALKPNGILALHGPDALVREYLKIMEPDDPIAWINWHYRFGQCNRSNWIDARCHCLVYAKNPQQYTWNPEEVLVDSDRAVVYADSRVDETDRGGKRLPGTVWGVPSDGPYWGRVQGNNAERQKNCPNQLPEVYLERLLRAYTNKGDRVLDPFAGSGTTATVAKELGREFVTIDVSEESCETVRERVKKGAVRVYG